MKKQDETSAPNSSSSLLTGLNDLNVLCGVGGGEEVTTLSGMRQITCQGRSCLIRSRQPSLELPTKRGGAERQSAAKAAERDWGGQRDIASFRQEEGFDQVGQRFVVAARSDGSGGRMIDGWGRWGEEEEEEEEIKRRVCECGG